MKKINNKSMNYGLKILTILAFVSIFVPFNMISAQVCSQDGCNYIYGTAYGSGSYSPYINNNYSYSSVPYQAPTYVPAPAPTPVPVVYSNSTNPNATTTAPKTVAKAKTIPKITAAVACAVPVNNSCNNSNLAANAVSGSNGFFPSGLIQWILLAIFILLIVVLTRMLFGSREKYLATPLKHN